MASAQFNFPEELTIYEVANIYSELKAFIQENDDIALSLINIGDFDSSGIQLVLKVLHEINKENITLTSFECSELVKIKFEKLGLKLPTPNIGDV